MQRVALVTDSTAGLSPSTAAELGITLVPASFAFAEERTLDDAADWNAVYARMESSGIAPRTFGVAESAFRTAFDAGLKQAEAVFCLVTPFDVNPSFTTACAAMLAVQFDSPEAKIKVANAGVGAAGLGALWMTLATATKAGASVDQLLELVESLEPSCDSLFVPGDVAWLERSGKLSLVEERIGAIDGRSPVVRVGTRITGISVEDSPGEALKRLVRQVGVRAGDAAINVSVAHAGAARQAEDLASLLRAAYTVERLEIAELSATHGALLGPGTVGAGVSPVLPKEWRSA